VSEEQFRIGRFFLGKRSTSQSWCVCWFDPGTRQTRRASLGTSDFQEAKLRLAEYVTKNEALREAKPDEVLFEAILIRYWENHGRRLPSAEQAKYALASGRIILQEPQFQTSPRKHKKASSRHSGL
jgi:hypothetical protein